LARNVSFVLLALEDLVIIGRKIALNLSSTTRWNAQDELLSLPALT
jgi:hypothetical protein